MSLSVLGQVLSPDRYRQKFARSGRLSIPFMHERVFEQDSNPVLVINSKGSFVVSRPSYEGAFRCAFHECPIEDEGIVLRSLYQTLVELSSLHQWNIRCTSVQESVGRLRSTGFDPKSIVLSANSLPELIGVDIKQTEVRSGYLADIDGVRMFTSDLPERTAIIFGSPVMAGVYVRVQDYLGLMLLRVDRSIMVVSS